MSDEKLRRLERRYRESGDAEDGEAWLRERVRVEGWPVRRILESTIRMERAWRAFFVMAQATPSLDSHPASDVFEIVARPVTGADVLAWLDRQDDPLVTMVEACMEMAANEAEHLAREAGMGFASRTDVSLDRDSVRWVRGLPPGPLRPSPVARGLTRPPATD